MLILKALIFANITLANSCQNPGYMYISSNQEHLKQRTLVIANNYLFASDRISVFDFHPNGSITKLSTNNYLGVNRFGQLVMISNSDSAFDLKAVEGSDMKRLLTYAGSDTFFLCEDGSVDRVNTQGNAKLVRIYINFF